MNKTLLKSIEAAYNDMLSNGRISKNQYNDYIRFLDAVVSGGW